MIVEIICVGTEILMGNIVNTNAAYLSEQCAGLGLTMYYQSVVGDNPQRLEQLVTDAMKRSDILIFSGGLGPTARHGATAQPGQIRAPHRGSFSGLRSATCDNVSLSVWQNS